MKRKKDESPYAQVALLYDELVGNTAFDLWRENFERLVERYGIRYRLAADVACGTGLAAVYMSERAERVYAVDGSPSMLEVARGRVDPGKVTLLRQQFTGLELPEKVDLLTCNFDSLNYVTEESQLLETLNRFGRSVAEGGYALFDLNTTRELEIEWGTNVFVHRVESGIALWETEWDPESRTNTLHMTNFIRLPGGDYRMSEEVHRECSYDVDLVVAFLNRAGFSAVDFWDAKGLTGVGEDTRRVQFLARR